MNSNRTLPTFFILGAQKAGTTWLHSILKSHPELGFGLKKEIHFFDYSPTLQKGVGWYESQFAHNVGKKHIGDCTPKYLRMVNPDCYLNDPQVPQDALSQLKEICPNPKFIVLLRNPVERAISAYYMHLWFRNLKSGQDILSVPAQHNLLMAGEYADQLKIWFEHFPRENFLILFYEESIKTAAQQVETLKLVTKFLEVNEDYVPTNLHQSSNQRATPYETYLRNKFGKFSKPLLLAPKWIKNLAIWKIEIPASSIQELEEYYKKPNKKLSSLLGRDLPW